MFINTWLILILSPIRCSDVTSARKSSNSCCFALACGRIMVPSSSISSARLISVMLSVVFPLSILLISNTSLIKPRRYWLEAVIFRAYSFTRSESPASWFNSTVRPTIAFIGVRISWLILFKKVLFALLAAFAAFNAVSKANLLCRSFVLSDNTTINLSDWP